MEDDLLAQDDGGFASEEVAFSLSHLLSTNSHLLGPARKASEMGLDEGQDEDLRLLQLDRSNLELDVVESLDLRRRRSVLWLIVKTSVRLGI